MGLNEAQQGAVSHNTGPCMVVAGPGSGKTYTIAQRIRFLIKKCKVRPEEILVITFTRAASYEMRSRFQELMEGENFPVTFGTFHGVYFGILKWAYRFGSENILTEEEKYRMLRQILESPEIDYDLEMTDENEEIRELAVEIGNIKNRGISLDTYESPRFGIFFEKLYLAYERTRKQFRKIDFDDMLSLCYDLLKKRPDLLAKWQQKFRYILIDEFQDVNRIQYEVIRMLALPENNLFVVGDDDQSIYQFRGASPQIMLGFTSDYPNAVRYDLDMNYRCSGNILKGALRVIGNNQNRYVKCLKPANQKGETIHVQEVNTPEDESLYLVKKVEELIKEGSSHSQIAVLYRTAMEARVLMETLVKYQLPFSAKEQISNIYEHFIAKHIISYLKLSRGERNRKNFLEVMNVPVRYISRDSLESETVSFEDMRNFYMDKSWMLDRIDQFEWDVKMMENQTPYAAIQYVRKHIGYDDYLKEYAKEHKISSEDLFAVLSEIQERAKEFSTMEEWFVYIAAYSEALRRNKAEKNEKQEGIRLMTMHGAKGLEFDTVFIIHANEGISPYKKAKLDEEIEEERRMFYVAMTRARQRLVISYVKTKNGKAMSPSRFVKELLLIQ